LPFSPDWHTEQTLALFSTTDTQSQQTHRTNTAGSLDTCSASSLAAAPAGLPPRPCCHCLVCFAVVQLWQA
jgi:hypothetical protein